MDIKFKDYIAPILKWWWLLIISSAIAAVTSYWIVLPQPPVYQAQVTLIVGRAMYDPNPSGFELDLPPRLANAYAASAMHEPIQNATMEVLNLSELPEYAVTTIPNSPFIEISVTDIDPLRAQAVANELANQLVLQSPTGSQQEEQERQIFINQQLEKLQEDIIRTNDEIMAQQTLLSELTGAAQIADTQAALNALDTKLTILQTSYATLLESTQGGALNVLSVFYPADLPATPIGPNKPLIIIAAAAAGLVLAIGAAYVIEFLDDTVRTNEQVVQLIPSPIIGHIALIPKKKKPWTHVAVDIHSPVSEAFRALKTNIDFTAINNPLNTLLISSADAGEGKTTVSTNLAISMALSNKKVVLLEADLRRPQLQFLLEKEDVFGLTDIILGQSKLSDVIIPWDGLTLEVIPAGTIPPNPLELITSKKMDDILSELKERADIIIIDGPPFIITETSILADKADGLLLVVRPGFTREGKIKAMIEQIERVGAKVIGIALNQIPQHHMPSYGGYLYNSNYYLPKKH